MTPTPTHDSNPSPQPLTPTPQPNPNPNSDQVSFEELRDIFPETPASPRSPPRYSEGQRATSPHSARGSARGASGGSRQRTNVD